MSLNIIPTFILRGIDPLEILNNYNNNVYSNVFLNNLPKEKIKISPNIQISAPIYGSSTLNDTFSMKDKNNCTMVFHSTNHKNFDYFIKNDGKKDKGGRCEWCKQDFKEEVIGIPYAFKEEILTLLDFNSLGDSNIKSKNIYCFWTEGTFCSFECALAQLLIFSSIPIHKKEISENNAEKWLKFEFSLIYPNDILIPAPFYRLLEANGGSMKEVEFRGKNKHLYKRTSNLVIIPMKTLYLKN